MARQHRDWGVLLAGVLIASALILPVPFGLVVDARDLPNPPTQKWSVWFPKRPGTGLPIPLPDPIRDAGVAVLAWFRTPQGLYTPMVRLLNGSSGSVIEEISGLPSMSTEAAILLNATTGGDPEDIVVGDWDRIIDIDLGRGQVRWTWLAPDTFFATRPLQPIFTTTPTATLFATDTNGTIYGLSPADGAKKWEALGRGNWFQAGGPAVVTVGDGEAVVATESAIVNDSWAVLQPPVLRLVDIDSGGTRWRLPLTYDPVTVATVAHVGPHGEPLLIFFDTIWSTNSTERVFAVSPDTGDIQWNTTWEGTVPYLSGSDVPVLNTSGGPLLFAPSSAGEILRVNLNNGVLDDVPTACNASISDAFLLLTPVDFAGDGLPELLGVMREGGICVLSVPSLEVLWSQRLPRVYETRPSLGDIDRDGRPELVVTSEDGYVTAFDVDPIPPTPSRPNDTGLEPVLVGVGVGVVVIVLLAACIVWRKQRGGKPENPTPEEAAGAVSDAKPPETDGKL